MGVRTCSVPGCDKPLYAKALCNSHYKRERRSGDVQADKGIGERVAKICSVEGCDNGATERGWCHGHYLRWVRLGDVQPDRPLNRRVNLQCSVERCDRPATNRGMCRAHGNRERKFDDVQPEQPIRGRGGRRCAVDGCDRAARSRGLCRPHLYRQRRYGDVQAGKPVDKPLEGHVSHGYRIVCVPKELRHLTYGLTTIAEHRLVMAVNLGRPLRPDESVHHKNGDRLDNRIENLELWSRWQPNGQRVCDKLTWAREFMRMYAPTELAENILF